MKYRQNFKTYSLGWFKIRSPNLRRGEVNAGRIEKCDYCGEEKLCFRVFSLHTGTLDACEKCIEKESLQKEKC
jgi:hypothetical protein